MATQTSTRKTKNLRKIVWAADALSADPELRDRLLRSLHALTQTSAGTRIQIEPVYVLSPDQLRIPGEISTDSVAHFESLAERQLRELIDHSGIENLLPPRILIQTYPSLRGSVMLLIDHARASGADAIVVATHSRGGIQRAVLGSFAETLVYQSDIPVFVVNPHSKPMPRLSHILVPSNFDVPSESVFEQTIEILKDREGGNGEITLFHQIVDTPPPAFRSGTFATGGEWMELSALMDRYREDLDSQAAEWKKRGEAKGVRVHIDIREPADRSVAESIVDAARRSKADCIAMGTNHDSMMSILLGSITRKVIRTADEPVFILHPPKSATKSAGGRSAARLRTKKSKKKKTKAVAKKKTSKNTSGKKPAVKKKKTKKKRK